MNECLKSRIGVDIFQPVIPDYRVALLEGLDAQHDLDVSVQASSPFVRNGSISVPLKIKHYNPRHVCLKIGPFFWQKNNRFVCAKKRGDVIVICGNVLHLSNYWLVIKAMFLGIGVIWWGHHRSSTSTEWAVKLRLFITKCFSDIFLCYTEAGGRFLVERGFNPQRVCALGNTINEDEILVACREWTNEKLREFQKENGLLGKRVFLFCGRLKPRTQLDVLFRAMTHPPLKNLDMILVVIGDGSERQKFTRIAEEVGVAGRVRWLGQLSCQDKMAPWFLSSELFVYPGAIGLSLLHAFSYGLPVVAHDNREHQMPEFDLLTPNETGFYFEEGNASDLSRVAHEALSDKSRLSSMSEKARKVVYEKYNMSNMVNNFKQAILMCSNRKRKNNVAGG